MATVDQTGLVTPVSDGAVTITAKANGQSATAALRVKAAQAPFTWSFRNHVIPVMTKMGCNSGACHGALAGKNGFKLTLRGYDPDVDYDTLTRQSDGRRVSLSSPADSLILLKPTLTIPHGGGKRFAVNSLEYRVIAEWIAAGTPPPAESDPQITGLEVYPASAILKPEAEQQLVVRAKYSDGQVRDVTRWVKFSSSDEGVATVDDSGHVKMTGFGRGRHHALLPEQGPLLAPERPVSEQDRSGHLHQVPAQQFHRRSGDRETESAEHRSVGAGH